MPNDRRSNFPLKYLQLQMQVQVQVQQLPLHFSSAVNFSLVLPVSSCSAVDLPFDVPWLGQCSACLKNTYFTPSVWAHYYTNLSEPVR